MIAVHGAIAPSGWPMPTEITPQVKHETWLDLLPDGAPHPAPGDMLTQEMLLEALRERGVRITPDALAWREKNGELPQGVRLSDHGPEHLLYPSFAVDALAWARNGLSGGQPLHQDLASLVQALVGGNDAGPRHETWQDPPWSHPNDPEPEHLVTRVELLASLRKKGLEISDQTLRTWQREGIVPRPLRRWHNDRVVALYAPWVADIIGYAIAMRNGGRSLADMRTVIRGKTWAHPPENVHAFVHITAGLDFMSTSTVTPSRPGDEGFAQRWDEYRAAVSQLAGAVQVVARLHARALVVPVTEVEMKLFAEGGGVWIERFPINPEDSALASKTGAQPNRSSTIIND